jgi:hypothetical protein
MIFQEWPEGVLPAFTSESGIFDDTPLYNLLQSVFDQSPNGV